MVEAVGAKRRPLPCTQDYLDAYMSLYHCSPSVIARDPKSKRQMWRSFTGLLQAAIIVIVCRCTFVTSLQLWAIDVRLTCSTNCGKVYENNGGWQNIGYLATRYRIYYNDNGVMRNHYLWSTDAGIGAECMKSRYSIGTQRNSADQDLDALHFNSACHTGRGPSSNGCHIRAAYNFDRESSSHEWFRAAIRSYSPYRYECARVLRDRYEHQSQHWMYPSECYWYDGGTRLTGRVSKVEGWKTGSSDWSRYNSGSTNRGEIRMVCALPYLADITQVHYWLPSTSWLSDCGPSNIVQGTFLRVGATSDWGHTSGGNWPANNGKSLRRGVTYTAGAIPTTRANKILVDMRQNRMTDRVHTQSWSAESGWCWALCGSDWWGHCSSWSHTKHSFPYKYRRLSKRRENQLKQGYEAFDNRTANSRHPSRIAPADADSIPHISEMDNASMFTGMDDEHPGYTFYPNPTGLSDVVVELTPSIGGLSRDHLAERSAPQRQLKQTRSNVDNALSNFDNNNATEPLRALDSIYLTNYRSFRETRKNKKGRILCGCSWQWTHYNWKSYYWYWSGTHYPACQERWYNRPMGRAYETNEGIRPSS